MYSAFLTSLVSTAGANCIVSIDSGRRTKHYWCNFANEPQVAGIIRDLQSRGTDTYFALGAFTQTAKGELRRTADSCVALRAFWMDIDAGPEKAAKHGNAVYASQQEAINALYAVLTKGALAKPTYVVSSGAGLHVYWASVEDISPAEWATAARRLRNYCQREGLRIDTARAEDRASVLRPIGTTNFKSGNLPVRVIDTGRLFHKHDLLVMLNNLPGTQSISAPPTYNQQPVIPADSSMAGMFDRQPASFGKIIELQHYQSMGCRQLMHCYMEQATLDEPLWFAALSVAQFCIDRDEWIHRLSSTHPAYRRGETEQKAAHAKGPKSCEHFEALNPGGCNGCPHRGKISNPIVLGHRPAERPTVVQAQLGTDPTQTDEFVIPQLPWPYYRKPDGGGIYIDVPKRDQRTGRPKTGDDIELEEFQVCPYDVYVFERIREDKRQRYWCRYHSPHDGVIEFELNSDLIHTLSDGFKSTIRGAGIPLDGPERWKHMMTFLNRQVNNYIESRAAVEAVMQMGWTTKGEFVIGDRIITRNGCHNAPVADLAIAKKMARAFSTPDKTTQVLQLETWNSVLHEMYGDDAALANQFIIATAVGAPLNTRFSLESHCGGIISLSSSGSGRGKTFTCQTALRVFGDPKYLTLSSKDGATSNALMTNVAYLNSLPLLRDEITEMGPDEVIGLAYDSTRLGDKERAQGSNNDIRENRMNWRTFFYATANTSMYDMMSSGRDVADGPVRRVTELQIQELTYMRDVTKANRLAEQLHTVQGVAGQILLEWVVRNEDEAHKLWENTHTWFTNAYSTTPEERFWVNHLVTGCVGAVVAQKLGILPFDPRKVIQFAGQQLLDMRNRIGYRAMDKKDYLSQLIQENLDCILNIGAVSLDGMAAVELPRSSVLIRLEPKNGMMYINPTLIKRWCSQRRIVLADIELEIKRRGGKANVKKNMVENTILANTSPPQKVWAIPMENRK